MNQLPFNQIKNYNSYAVGTRDIENNKTYSEDSNGDVYLYCKNMVEKMTNVKFMYNTQVMSIQHEDNVVTGLVTCNKNNEIIYNNIINYYKFNH